MISKETLRSFLNKKVFVKIIDDKVQVGILKEYNDTGDFYLETSIGKTVINREQIARITEEGNYG